MTRLISASVVGVPLIGGVVVLIYAVVKYWAEDFGPSADNAFHQVFGAVALFMLVWALRASLTLNSYTTRCLYQMVPLTFPSAAVARVVKQLFHSVDPGTVDPTPPAEMAVLGGAWQSNRNKRRRPLEIGPEADERAEA